MNLIWHARGDYSEIGKNSILQEAVNEALSLVPPEHLRRLDAIEVHDRDRKRKSLGLWRQDHSGIVIEVYLEPHVAPLLFLPPPIRSFALRGYLAYTLFHEVGHHVTRVLNRRAAPPRKAALVEEKIEKWADQYAEKRIAKLCALWLRPEGRAASPSQRLALQAALRALRLPDIEGTNTAIPSS